MSVRNGIAGLPDDPELGEMYDLPDGYVFIWTVNGWKVVHEPFKDVTE